MVWEGSDVLSELRKNPDDYDVGDTIEYITNNQQGYKKYEVVLDSNRIKNIKLIASYDKDGGRKTRRNKKKRTHKKRKTHKRKTT
jgi:hypothetical protein